jgi:hypothetical protein
VSRIRPLLRPLLALVAVAVIAPVLSACSAASQAGTAAVVGARQISVSDLQQATRDIQGVLGPDAGITQADVLYYMIIAPFATKEAAARNVGVSENDVLVWQRQTVSGNGSKAVPELSPAAVETMQGALSLQRLSSLEADAFQSAYDELGKSLTSAGVKVNPRYGRFDMKQFDAKQVAVVPVTPDWITQTATPTPTPTPTAS